MSLLSRQVSAPRGATITCKGWPQEAALRMLMNNLDPEVAERPEDLVVYGGSGRAARSGAAYDAMVATLRRLVSESLGPLRDGTSLAAARERLASWRCDSRAEEDVTAVASLMLAAAIARRESRGAHYRSDYPMPAAGTPVRQFASPRAMAVESMDPARSRVA